MSFDPYKTKFQIGAARWMARLAGVVYTRFPGDTKPDAAAIQQTLLAGGGVGRGVSDVYAYDKNSAQSIVVSHQNHISAVFRGTDEKEDWVDNLNINMDEALFGHFHSGFLQSFRDVWYGKDGEDGEDGMNAKIKELQEKKKRPVWLTGHSLGGAMATVAAASFIDEDRPFYGVYTFGQPRCVDRKTCHIFNMEAKDRYYRFQNNNDIVSRVPPRNPVLPASYGYRHVGQCVYISEEGKLHSSPSFWFKFLDAIDGMVEARKQKGIDFIEDHKIKNYLMAIEDWMDGSNNLPLDD